MNRFQQLYDYVEANKPEVFLEVGTWNGQNAKRLFKEGIKKYIGFDIWEDGSEELDVEENNAKKRVSLGAVQEVLKDYDVELIMGNTRTVGLEKGSLPKYIKGKDRFVDCALIDGGHSKGTIRSDLLNVLRIMKPDGVVFLDDYYFDCPQTNIGAQTVLCEMNIAYTVLPWPEKAADGSIIKMVRIDCLDVPTSANSDWDMGDKQVWAFEPGEAE